MNPTGRIVGRIPPYNCLTTKQYTFYVVFKDLSYDAIRHTYETISLSWDHLKISGSGGPNIWTPITLAPIRINISFDRHIKGHLEGFMGT